MYSIKCPYCGYDNTITDTSEMRFELMCPVCQMCFEVKNVSKPIFETIKHPCIIKNACVSEHVDADKFRSMLSACGDKSKYDYIIHTKGKFDDGGGFYYANEGFDVTVGLTLGDVKDALRGKKCSITIHKGVATVNLDSKVAKYKVDDFDFVKVIQEFLFT